MRNVVNFIAIKMDCTGMICECTGGIIRLPVMIVGRCLVTNTSYLYM